MKERGQFYKTFKKIFEGNEDNEKILKMLELVIDDFEYAKRQFPLKMQKFAKDKFMVYANQNTEELSKKITLIVNWFVFYFGEPKQVEILKIGEKESDE